MERPSPLGTTSVTSSHPLSLELHSLRSALSRFQHVAHHASMQLQGKVMELTMSKERESRLAGMMKGLEKEVEILRSNPNPSLEAQNPTSSSKALSELTLAHRRLTHLLETSQARALSLAQELSTTQSELRLADGRVEAAEEREAQMWDRFQGIEEELKEEKEARRMENEEKKVLELALNEAMGRLGSQEEMRAEVTDNVKQLMNGHGDESVVDDSSTSEIASSMEELNEVQESKMAPYSSTEAAVCPTCSFAVTANANTSNKPLSNSTSLPPSTPSNILLGLQGIRRLFTDFSSSLSTKEQTIYQLEHEMEGLKQELTLWRKLEGEERRRRVESVDEAERLKESDEGAAKVVERYMAFTQKTTTQLHQTMLAQTSRLNATITTLRSRLLSSETQLSREIARSITLRAAMDELADGFERETFGRRRETALRIKCLEREERWAERGERWRDRVRRERGRLGVASTGGYGMGSASASTTSLNSLMSPTSTTSGMLPPSRPFAHDEQVARLWELLESGLQLFSVDESPLADVEVRLPPSADQPDGIVSVDGHTSRRILAEEIFLSLMEDLKEQTKRRVSLEKENMTRLAIANLIDDDVGIVDESEQDREVEAPHPEGSIPTETEIRTSEMQLVIESSDSEATPKLGSFASMANVPELASHKKPSSSAMKEAADIASPVMDEDPAVTLVRDQISRVPERYTSMQKSLHDCAYSLSSLREEISGTSSTLDEDTAAKRLTILLDGIHDVIEDVRVEVEIAIADDERVGAGLQTLLTLNPDQKSLSSARAFVDADSSSQEFDGGRKITGFKRRLADVEHDLVEIKVAAAALQTEAEEDALNADAESDITKRETLDAISRLQLRTVAAPSRVSSFGDLSGMPSPGITSPGNGLKRGFFGSLGRSLSGTTPRPTPTALHAPQRMVSMNVFRSTSLSAGSVGILGGSSNMHSGILPTGQETSPPPEMHDKDSEDDVE